MNNDKEVKNATIKNSWLTIENGVLEIKLDLEYEVWNQVYTSPVLYLPVGYTHYNRDTPTGHHIFRLLEIAGVNDWKDLNGRNIRVSCDGDVIFALGHIVKDDWFHPKTECSGVNNGTTI